jgi:hypothetical protein
MNLVKDIVCSAGFPEPAEKDTSPKVQLSQRISQIADSHSIDTAPKGEA